MPPRVPEVNAIARPERSDGKAPRRPPPERVLYAQSLMVGDGASYSDCVAALRSKFGIGTRQAAQDIAEMRLQLKAIALEIGPIILAQETARKQRIARKAEASGEYQAAVAASNAIVKENGAGAADRIEHTFLSDEDYADELLALKADALAEADTTDLVAELERRGCRVTLPDEAELVQ